MKVILLACFFSLIGLGGAQQLCPPAQVLSPCVCDEFDKIIGCSNIGGDVNLKEIFDNASAYAREGFTFDSLRITQTELVEIEAGAVQSLRFLEVRISGNQQLSFISPRAFKEGRSAIRYLRVDENMALEDGGNLWEFVASLTNLRDVTLTGKGITSIPADALQSLPGLGIIRLNGNNISHIGSRAFAGTPHLNLIYLNNNSLPSQGLPEDAFEGISSNAVVSLKENEGLEFLEEKSYKALLDQAAVIIVGDAESRHKFYCDERVDWICDNEGSYRRKLLFYDCKDRPDYEQIWDYCAERNSTV